MQIIPNKLKRGDRIRVIAPSRSLTLISPENRALALKRLEELGLTVTFGNHVYENDLFTSSSIESRIADLHEAFADPQVNGILTVIGGFNCNQLLQYIDYSLVKNNPKVFCGFSDITALSNAFYAKTGLVSYSGPHFSSFGMLEGFDYSREYFKKCLFSDEPFEISPASFWSDDAWYLDQLKREFIPNHGYKTLVEGKAEGIIIGGNLCTLNLLQGTEYMPSLEDSILFIEDDYESHAATFDRDLQSLMHQPGFDKVRGLVIGRFQNASEISMQKLTRIIHSKPALKGIPVITEVDFGHTYPQITFPIGGRARITASFMSANIEIQ